MIDPNTYLEELEELPDLVEDFNPAMFSMDESWQDFLDVAMDNSDAFGLPKREDFDSDEDYNAMLLIWIQENKQIFDELSEV